MKAVKRFFIKILLIMIVITLIIILAVLGINSHVKNKTEDKISYVVNGKINFNSAGLAEIKQFDPDCIIVLGAGIKDSETPSDMLKDRLDVGIELYKQGVAPKLLLTGDNGTVNHNEIHVMLSYAKKAGIPEKDIFCDHAGFSTYESMYRADSIFKVKSAVVVTQEYHEYRALYIGDKLGIDVLGVSSDQRSYFGQTYRDVREILARCKDFVKCIIKPEATGGEAIPINGSGINSHGE